MQGQPERAARLFGVAEALREILGVPVLRHSLSIPALRGTYERDVAAIRAALGAEACGAAWAAGRALPLEDAVAEALGQMEHTSPDPSGATG
jgi:hypothetical protein